MPQMHMSSPPPLVRAHTHTCATRCLQVDKKLQGGFLLEFEDRLVDVSTAKKQSEFNQMVAKLENDLL